MDSKNYLALLNEEQRAAVEHNGKSLLILAGAGSGKTRVITTKIAYMIQKQNVPPRSILAVTFTKKAADEMRERALKLEETAASSQIKTFHSFGAYFLRQFAEYAGLSSTFTVYDEDDSVSLLLKAVKELQRKDAAQIVKQISRAKDLCLASESPELDLINEDPSFREMYEAYENRLRTTGNVDFGDLIMLPCKIMEENPSIKERVQNRFKVIMVDEYQDSNVAQFRLLKNLVGPSTYICVVGDDDQSIYKFRGAEISNILNFQSQFPGTDLIKLEKNYRSTSQILECANGVIKNNKTRLGKKLISVRGKGKLPVAVYVSTQDDEVEFCRTLIENAHEKGVPYSDWAILYRTNAQSLGFENEFVKYKIPYEIVGSLKFFEREEVKDIVAWLSFLVNPRDEISFRRIINKPARGIENSTQDKILDMCLNDKTLSIIDACKKISLPKKAAAGMESFLELYENFLNDLPIVEQSVKDDLDSLVQQAAMADEEDAKEIIQENEKKSLSVFIKDVIEKSGFREYYAEKDKNEGSLKVSNMEELVNHSIDFLCTREELVAFLEMATLESAALNEAALENEELTDKVILITVHNTKGLEFPRVIITGMEQGIFPREEKFGEELEEERRLFYVGITRAQNELYFTSSGLRRIYGMTKFMNPSVFMGELPSSSYKVLGTKPTSINREDSISSKYQNGTLIYHDDYGQGTVVRGFYSEGNYVIKILFEGGFEKIFIPKFQSNKLQIIK